MQYAYNPIELQVTRTFELIILDTNGSLQHWTSLLYVRNIEQVYYM